MLRLQFVLSLAALASLGLTAASDDAPLHRATRLGHPATRFAEPLKSPADLRKMLASPALRADVEYIVRECGYSGDLADFHRAAATSEIHPLQIPVGMRLRAMSSRSDGRPILLREVLWAGREPIDAYEFFFASQGRRYRVVTPKACANFWVQDDGKVLSPALALRCEAPAELALNRPASVCLTLENTGDDIEPRATLALEIPVGATCLSATEGGKIAEGQVLWAWPNLAPQARPRVCATFSLPRPGPFAFGSNARGTRAAPAQCSAVTRVTGVPGILLEVVDLADPISVGENQTYEITVLNQGTAPLTNIGLRCTPDERQQFVAGDGTTAVQAGDRVITVQNLAVLAPRETAVWRISVRTLRAGDARFHTSLTCDQFQKPITETEATQQY